MPIHDQGYRHYGGYRGAGGAWRVIAWHHIVPMFRQRRFLFLLLVSWAPFVVRAVQIYVSANFPQASFLGATAQTFREFLSQQGIFVFLISIAFSGLIADDRRANALQVYLSKPLTRVEYIVGKLAAVLAFLLAVTFAPAILLLFLQMMFAGSTKFVSSNLFLIPAITLFSIVQSLLAACALLAVSSLSNSRRFVSIMFAGIVFFTAAMYQALRTMTGSTAWAWISPGETLSVLGDAIFRVQGRPAIPAPVALVVIVLMIAASIVVLERRVRGVEVVT